LGIENKSLNRDSDLPQIVEANSHMSMPFGSRKGREEHGCQEADDCDDNQEFDECEGWNA